MPSEKTEFNLREIIQDSYISKEKKRLLEFYKEIPKDKMQLIEGLIDEAAFLKCALIQCKKILQSEGLHTVTENGSQKFVKSHPTAKTYNDYMKQYNSLINDLVKHLPADNNRAVNVPAKPSTPKLDALRNDE